jgi:putative heme iron utilization protein
VTVADDGGRLILLLSALAEHTQNLQSSPDASVLLVEPAAADRAPLSLARVTLLGPCTRVADGERDAIKRLFLAAHPDAAQYVDFKDFAFYRLVPLALRYVGGFGRMSWVNAVEYLAATPDPIAPLAAGILAHMNTDHADANLAYARALAGIADASAAVMTSVDRYGFDLAVSAPGGEKKARLGFDAPVSTADEVRRAMVALVKAARSAPR